MNFYTRNAASNNTSEARLRESTRMCAIAYGLSTLGCDVRIVDAPDELTSSDRWQFFRHLHGTAIKGPRVDSAESGVGDVGIKCSVNTRRDREHLARCQTLVAHEYEDAMENHHRLLKVPFLVHDRVLSGFVELELFQAWLDNDIYRIREAFPWQPEKGVGFCGAGWKHRKAFLRDAPDWVECRFYDTHPMSGVEHARWLCGFKGGLCLRGDTPKTNLPVLLALLGVPIVMQPISRIDTPPISRDNAIMFSSWEQVHSELEDVTAIRDRATRDYIESWSPTGQARLLMEAF